MRFLNPIFGLLPILILSLGCNAVEELSAQTGTVETLPLDRFDEYPAGKLPPHPWQMVGDLVEGVSLELSSGDESPFVKNEATGKGLVLKDESATGGSGLGIRHDFLAPPEGELYLGFDFRLDEGSEPGGVEFAGKLLSAEGTGIGLHLGRNGSLSVEDSAGQVTEICALETGRWYHLSVLLPEIGDATISLRDATKSTWQRSGPQVRKSVPVSNPATPFTRLIFSSEGPDAAVGGWALDNVCMAGQVDAVRRSLLPFDQLPLAELHQSPRKVFAYYFIYGSGVDQYDPGLSWYTRTVLNPSANQKKDRADAGTELLYRPLPRPPLPSNLSQDELMLMARTEEVRLARRMGIDGFLADFWSDPHPTNGQSYFQKNSFALLDAARDVDPEFKILPAVYSGGKSGIRGEGDQDADPIEYANSPTIQRILQHPATLRLEDGRVVLSMWLTERHSPGWWKRVIAELERQGHPIALVCQFNSYNTLQDFSPIAYGMAHWGPREPRPFDWTAKVRDLTTKVVYPICAQDVRTRGCALWEAGGSQTLTGLWHEAIETGADWTFLISWSDYSEQAMQPSSCLGFAPHDLNTYYTQWFKTGEQPPIVRDVLYYFYRKNHTEVDPGKGKTWSFRGSTKPRNEIELLAFLAKPGTLRIQVGDRLYEQEAPQGITRFTVPLPKGETFTPEFSLLRDGKAEATRKGHFTILDQVEYPHMLYSSGVITR